VSEQWQRAMASGVGCNGGLCCFAPDWRLPYWIAFPEAFVILMGVVAAGFEELRSVDSRHFRNNLSKVVSLPIHNS
jgi:hypothetical protein